MAKWIKNDSGGDKTWIGQLVSNGNYYEIQLVEEPKWISDSTLLIDIANGDAVVAKDDSGSNDIVDVNSAINYLKDNSPIQIDRTTPVHYYALSDGGLTLRARLIGIINQVVTKNQTTDVDWLIPQISYLGVNKQCYMDGINYFAKNAEVCDTMTFQVIDIDDIMGYGANTVLDEFGTNWGVMPNVETTIKLYAAKLVPGLYIRIKYTSIGTTNDIEFVCNLFRHMDTGVTI